MTRKWRTVTRLIDTLIPFYLCGYLALAALGVWTPEHPRLAFAIGALAWVGHAIDKASERFEQYVDRRTRA